MIAAETSVVLNCHFWTCRPSRYKEQSCARALRMRDQGQSPKKPIPSKPYTLAERNWKASDLPKDTQCSRVHKSRSKAESPECHSWIFFNPWETNTYIGRGLPEMTQPDNEEADTSSPHWSVKSCTRLALTECLCHSVPIS